LDYLGERFLDEKFRKEIRDKLIAETKDWIKTLPKALSSDLNFETLDLIVDTESARPELKRVAVTLRQGLIPFW